jgi:NAD(P)-dependent dehydrogenase (short-subunit alcohol dehydrogenase family)
MLSSLRDTVVVITGASGGIGRAAACAFARLGATTVLAARRASALEETLRECERLGGRGIVVPTDVGQSEQVDHLADIAAETYGRIDVWINNAAVSLFGRTEEIPREDYEQVLRTNMFGCVNGARAAIRQFREQGAGRLINVSSGVAHTAQPYTSAYVASKWAIRGLSDCLRMELADAPDITVTTVSPASTDTPIFQQAGNYTGWPIKPMPPVYTPERVASAIVRAVRFPKHEIFVGGAGRAADFLVALLPSFVSERLVRRQVEKEHFAHGLPVDANSGNIHNPFPGIGSMRGGWMKEKHPNRSRNAALVALAVTVPLMLYTRKRWWGA